MILINHLTGGPYEIHFQRENYSFIHNGLVSDRRNYSAAVDQSRLFVMQIGLVIGER